MLKEFHIILLCFIQTEEQNTHYLQLHTHEIKIHDTHVVWLTQNYIRSSKERSIIKIFLFGIIKRNACSEMKQQR